MLFELLADLSRETRTAQRDVTDRFAADPEGTCARYGVPASTLDCLERGDDDALVSLMTTELRGALAEVRGPTPMYWGRPSFRITSVAARSAAVAGAEIELAIAGEELPAAVAVQLQKDALLVAATVTTRTGAGELAARVRVPEPGVYNVVVYGTEDRERYGFLPGGLTVQAAS